jgi:hypothetical protein
MVDSAAPATSAKADTPEQRGFFRSMYDEGVAPVVDMVSDAINRGDLGEHSVQQILGAFKDQLWNFQQHPDIRNLPLVGPGATAVANRMQRQYDAGNYAGAAGTAAGFLVPFLAPGAIEAAADKLPEAAKTAAAAADATGDFAKAAAKGTAAGAKAAAPDLAIAGLKGAASAAFGSHVPYGWTVGGFGEWNAARQAFTGLRKGAQAFGEAYSAQRAADAGPAVLRESPAWADIQPSPASTPEFTPTPATALPSGRVPGSYAAAQARAAAEAPAVTVTPYERAQGDVLDVAPEARTESGTPALTAAQLLEDRIHEHHAYLLGQAEDIIWANRARKADRFAQWLIENKLPATPGNIDLAASRLAEKNAPSDETVPMIQDRVDWFNGKQQTVQ